MCSKPESLYSENCAPSVSERRTVEAIQPSAVGGHTSTASDLAITCAMCTPFRPQIQHFPLAFLMTVAITEVEIPAEEGQTFLHFLAGGGSPPSLSSVLGPSDSEAIRDVDPWLDGGLEGRLEKGLRRTSGAESARWGVWSSSSSMFMMLVVLGFRER